MPDDDPQTSLRILELIHLAGWLGELVRRVWECL
jgi:hypothetical protein